MSQLHGIELLLVKLRAGCDAVPTQFCEWLDGKIAKWWMPDEVLLVDAIPLGATGKVDKKALRAALADYVLPDQRSPPD
jgi:fatty-acyl-CoA synthase